MPAIEPQNITGSVIGWIPTAELRWFGPHPRRADLQQLWRDSSTGETEWRYISFVEDQS